MDNQKSFIYWLITIVIVIAAAALGAFFYIQSEDEETVPLANQNTGNTNTTNSNTSADLNANTAASESPSLTPQSIDDYATLTLGTCVDDLFSDDYDRFEAFSNTFDELHPELQAISAGSACELSNGMETVSFSHQDSTGSARQTIAVFDADGNYVNETMDFYCPTLGDLLAPHIQSLNSGYLKVYCWSGDGAIARYEEFEISLDDFTFEQTVSEEGEDVELEYYL